MGLGGDAEPALAPDLEALEAAGLERPVVAASPLSLYGDGTRVHPSFADKLPKKRTRRSVGGVPQAPQAPDPATFVLPPLVVGRQALGKRSARDI